MNRSLQIFSAVFLLGLFLVLSAYDWISPDIWFHLYLGRRILETFSVQPGDQLILQQASFVNIYWLFQMTCQAVFSLSGTVGLSAMFALLWLGIALLWIRIVGVFRRPVLGLPLALAALLACTYRFEPRPEIFSFFFLMLQIYWLVTWDFDGPIPKRNFLCYGVAEALWCNMHGFFPLGICLAGLMMVCKALSAKGLPSRSSVQLFAVAVFASFVSPLGYHTWGNVVTNWHILKDLHNAVYELMPPLGIYLKVWPVDIFWAWWIGTAVLSALYLFKGKANLFAALLAIPGLYLSATSLRNIPLAFFFGAPLVGAALRDATLLKHAKADAIAAVSTMVACLCLAVWAVQGGFYRSMPSYSGFGVHVSDAAYPVHFSRYLRETGFAGPMFNVSSDGGYLEYNFPDLRIYADSRFYDAQKALEYFSAAQNPYVFRRLIARYPFRGILLKVEENGPVVSNLLQGGDWQLAYADLHRAFFLQAPREAWNPRAFRTPDFYQGQDLSLRYQGIAAISWMQIMTSLDRPDQVVALLEAFSRSKTVPAPVLGLALNYGLRVRDPAVLARSVALRPKMSSMNRTEEQAVDKLMGAAAGYREEEPALPASHEVPVHGIK